MFPSQLTKDYDYYKYKDIYLQEIRSLFRREFNAENNKVNPAKHFPNIRLHYVDMRDYVSSNISSMDNSLANQNDPMDYLNSLWMNYTLTIENCDILKKQLDDSINFINKIGNLCKSSKSNLKEKLIGTDLENYTSKNFEMATKYIINKLLYKYKYDNIKKSMNNITNEYMNDQINLMNNTYNQCNKMIADYSALIKYSQNKIAANKLTGLIAGIGEYNTKLMMCDLFKNIYVYSSLNQNLFVILVDFYLLRRFLDKDYITNAISYTGGFHSLNYIYYLIKYFDFKITHWSYLNGSINEVYDTIKKANDPYDIAHYFFSNPIYQCSNLSDFPENFE